jgi:tripartite-type tricarboxylate transporter receptor subunit TctC
MAAPGCPAISSDNKEENMLTIRSVIHSAAAAMLLVSHSALAQEPESAWPSKPVTFIVPYAVGGPNELEARLWASKLQPVWGQPVLVDMKPGAGGAIGHNFVARAKPDGYTLLQPSGGFTILPALTRKLPYDSLKDLVPVTLMSRRASALVARPNFPANDFKEYLAYVKANPSKVNFGTTGQGSTAHMAGAWLQSASNTKATLIHYKGTAPMLNDLLGGQLDVAPSGLLSAMSLIRSGKLKALAVLEDRRSKLLPDLATVSEQGIPGFNSVLWLGVSVPAGTSAGIVNKLNAELVKVAQSPDVIAKMEAEGSVMVGSTPAQFRELIVSEVTRWQKVAQEAGIQPED